MPTLTHDLHIERRLPPPARTARMPPAVRPRARRLWVVLFVIVMAAGAAIAVWLPTRVTVLQPETMSLRDDAVGTGFVKAKVLVGVGARINGVIVAMHADQGDRVRAGQVLAELQNSDVQGQLRQAGHQLDAQRAGTATARATVVAARARLQATVSALEKAQAARRLADLTAGRIRSLFAEAVVSKGELDAAETRQAEAARDVDNAEALRAASAQLVAAAESDSAVASTLTHAASAGVDVQRANVAYTVVRSPIDGFVVTRDLEPGATVVPGLPIFTVADSSVIWVSASIDERELAGLLVGQPAAITVRSDPSRKIPGVVARIAQQADPVTEAITVDVAFAGQGGAGVRLNETAEVEILKREARATFAVPATVMIRGPLGQGVWLVRDGRLKMQAVETGIHDKRGWIEITRGLGPSDLVVLNPSLEAALSSGLRVRTRLVRGTVTP